MFRDSCSDGTGSANPLWLYVADNFWSRLRGVHGIGGCLRENEGLLILPCRAIHTFFLLRPLDVVFLDVAGKVCRCEHAMRPNRIAWEPSATMVVELPSGYCRRHPDYAQRIHAALQLRVFPRLSD